VAGRIATAQQEPDTSVPQLNITKVTPEQQRLETPPTVEQRKSMRERLGQARKALAAMRSQTITRISLTAELDRLERLLKRRRLSCNPVAEVKRLEQDLALAAAGETPHLKPGLHRLAYRSPLDSRLHSFAVFVPKGYTKAGRRYPLVVMLHGMRSNAMRATGRLFGLDDAQLRDSQLTCDRPAVGGQDVLVVAPGAFGDTFYRLAGERDVSTVVRLMTKLFRVDGRRITLTGLSMGGTGAVDLALQRPHLYAGVVALCGYYDRRLDSRVRGQSLQPWERFLSSVYSPVRWAVNGRGIPIVLIHGKRDGPRRARAMEQGYRKLGFPVKVEMYPTGHDVWTPGYKDGRVFQTLGKMRKGAPPRWVSFASGRSRIRRGHWTVIEAWEDYAKWAKVEARITDRQSVWVTTDNVEELRLDIPVQYLDRRKPTKLNVDGVGLEVTPKGQNRWIRRVWLRKGSGDVWSVEKEKWKPPEGELRKRPGLAGPMEDIYFDPILVVYGTGGGQGPALRRLGRKIAGYSRHANLRYKMISDRRYSPRWVRRRSVILVGNEQTNRVLARLGPQLPIRVTGGEVRVGKRSIKQPNVGATFIYPNPDSPRWYVLVVAGTTPESYKLWRNLPALLPDYVVFDEGVRSRRYNYLLGTRTLVDAGFFTSRWRLP
jgi:poly(3-hydroxybutyrate) depolymerase